ncbi:DNA damage-inducible transcript 4-like protein [Xenopus laevis]|uniref:DNA damage-inducible transcript 4-like protein n=2 Tax=Xenopus laevis TaxID=8355 RepID=A0A974DSH7_XENLA|nr:DNA damage-inducible transcript 4-like protein [Xenopus laevis]OCT97193.1 hypothetical protein XELAEV_18009421mg [Xenopus laevis]
MEPAGSDALEYLSNAMNIQDAFTVMRTYHLASMLENCLYNAKCTKLHCTKILVPKGLLTRVAQEILKFSLTEPCGLRGCILHVNLECGGKNLTLDTLAYDSAVEPTFEVNLVLKRESQLWDHLNDFHIPGTWFLSLFRGIVKLSPKFLLTKNVLYFSVGGSKDC